MLVELHGVSKSYGTGRAPVAALRGVDLDIAEGELLAIMGASGSGKSTLLNILGTLDRPSSGRYFLDGADVSALDDEALARFRNRHIGFVFQAFNLMPRLSAAQNVELPLLYAGVGRGERRRRARAALERVGLSDRLHHRPDELSGGQQQRVAIARALVTEPLLLLADEPTGALDSQSTAHILALLGELHAEGMTMVLVTHQPEVAARAQRLVRVADGRVIA